MADNEATCRYCGAPILWQKTEKGKNIPLDPDAVTVEQNRDAKFMLEEGDDVAIFIPAAERIGKLYTVHFDTCTDPAQQARKIESDEAWRKSQAK